MDNQETAEKSVELPAPVGGESASVTAPEQGVQPESQSGPSGGGPVQQPLDPAVAQQISAIVGGSPTATPAAPIISTSTGLHAADVDLIEKQWVHKAKEIVARTTGDPYTQNKEINKIKADYIKKRYNKDIKIASE